MPDLSSNSKRQSIRDSHFSIHSPDSEAVAGLICSSGVDTKNNKTKLEDHNRCSSEKAENASHRFSFD